MRFVSQFINFSLRILVVLVLLYAVIWWLPLVALLAFIYEYIQGKESFPDLIKKYISFAKDSIKDIFNYLKISS